MTQDDIIKKYCNFELTWDQVLNLLSLTRKELTAKVGPREPNLLRILNMFLKGTTTYKQAADQLTHKGYNLCEVAQMLGEIEKMLVFILGAKQC